MEEVKKPRIAHKDEDGGDLTTKDRLQEYHYILCFVMKDPKELMMSF
jgi:hypothetical protein